MQHDNVHPRAETNQIPPWSPELQLQFASARSRLVGALPLSPAAMHRPFYYHRTSHFTKQNFPCRHAETDHLSARQSCVRVAYGVLRLMHRVLLLPDSHDACIVHPALADIQHTRIRQRHYTQIYGWRCIRTGRVILTRLSEVRRPVWGSHKLAEEKA